VKEGTSYWWCNYDCNFSSSNEWAYCSPPETNTDDDGKEMTYQEEECRTPCQVHNRKYSFCYTRNSWDYCSMRSKWANVGGQGWGYSHTEESRESGSPR
jgi:hypothetical protein